MNTILLQYEPGFFETFERYMKMPNALATLFKIGHT